MLLGEAMAQTTAVYLLHQRGRALQADEVPLLVSIDCSFHAPVFPGDRIDYRTRHLGSKHGWSDFRVRATRGGRLVGRATVKAGVTRRPG